MADVNYDLTQMVQTRPNPPQYTMPVQFVQAGVTYDTVATWPDDFEALVLNGKLTEDQFKQAIADQMVATKKLELGF